MTEQQVQELLGKLRETLAGRQSLPESTYRLQFHAGFTFRDACAIVPYLRDLGITHCYASPYLQARPGSQHGYDIVSHERINPEVGSAEDYAAWVGALHEHGLGQVLDTVPNHMGVATNDNAWWNDVLENGPASRYAAYFDIAWQASPRPELQDRVLLPVLGEPYGDVLEKGQLRLSFEEGAFALHYYDRRFPVSPRSYALILGQRLEELEQALGTNADALLEYQSILTAVDHLPDRLETEPAKLAERQREKEVIKRRLGTLARESQPVREHIEQNVALFNGTPGQPHSFDLLDSLLNRQCYRLSYWRVAADEINYRRFFDVNDLAALSMEREEVFEATHGLIFRLLREGQVQGLRIDHPDGLYDPRQYLERLQQHYALDCARQVLETRPEFKGLAWDEVRDSLREALERVAREDPRGLLARPLYVVVEKILGSSEPLPEDWPVSGTSGYDFLNVINGLFVDSGQAKELTRLYRERTGMDLPFPEVVYQKKFLILQVSLASELHMLAYQLDRLAQKDRRSRDFTLNSLRHALRAVIACFPVYRSYISDQGVHEEDRQYVDKAVRRAKLRNPLMSGSLFDFIRDLLLRHHEGATEADRAEQVRFAGKFQQVTAPVMAKGLEDTTFYVYNRLLSLNEVGGDPGRFGVPPEELHRYNAGRQARWPWSLSPLSTHDTKRSEDVRARLNVLSEIPREWQEALERWGHFNEGHRKQIDEDTAPDPNEEYLLYQTLVGAWPLEPYSPEEYAGFVKRIQAYMEKALHEAKVHTSWVYPNAAYDQAVQEFVARILDEKENAPFLEDFRSFQRRVSHHGLFNSLAQTLLKMACPGVADTYPGTELWDFSLVDPDNRRPVDYNRRRHLLQELQKKATEAGEDRRGLARELAENRADGRIKLYLTTRTLHCRREHPGLFATGDYLPLEVASSGNTAVGHVFAFARRQGERWAVVAVPRLLTGLVSADRLPLGPEVWGDARLVLPDGCPRTGWSNLYTGEVLGSREEGGRSSLALAEVFGHFPVALLINRGT